MSADRLEAKIRGRVITSLYAGDRRAGDRLPSVRRLGEELGADPRAVLRVYRKLEEEGLVEIRTRSGVYLAEQRQVAPDLEWETSEWVASDVLTEAWRRRIPFPELPDFLRRCTGSVRLRIACIDRVEDVRVALCHEFETDFGLEATAVSPDSDFRASPVLEDILGSVDLVACTVFEAPSIRAAVERLAKPLVVVSVNPVALERVGRTEGSGALTFVIVDRAFRPRLRHVFGEEARIVILEDVEDDPPREGRLVYSRAAARRAKLPDAERFVPSVPVLSPETVRDLSHWIVRLNLERGG